MSSGNYSAHSPLQSSFAGSLASRNPDGSGRAKYRGSGNNAMSGHRARMSSGGITEEEIYGNRSGMSSSRIPLGGRGRNSFDQETAYTTLSGSNSTSPSTLTRKLTRTRNSDAANPSSPVTTSMPARSRVSLPAQASQISPPSSQRQKQYQQQQHQSFYSSNTAGNGPSRPSHTRGNSDMGIYAFSESSLSNFGSTNHTKNQSSIYGNLDDDLDMLKELDAIQKEADMHLDLQSQVLARHRGMDDKVNKRSSHVDNTPSRNFGYQRTESPIPDSGEASDTTNDDGFGFLDRPSVGSSSLRNEHSLGGSGGNGDEFLFDLHAEQPPWMLGNAEDPPSPTFGPTSPSGKSSTKKKSADKSRRKKLSVSTNVHNENDTKERSAKSPKSSSTRSKNKQARSEMRSPRSAAIRDRPPTPAPADMADCITPDDDVNDIQHIAMLPPSAVQTPQDVAGNGDHGVSKLEMQISMTTSAGEASPGTERQLETSDSRPFSPLPPDSPVGPSPAEVRQQLRERLREQHQRKQPSDNAAAAAAEADEATTAVTTHEMAITDTSSTGQSDKPTVESRHRPSTSRDTFATMNEEAASIGFSTHSVDEHEHDGTPSIASSQHSDSIGMSGDVKQKRSAASAAKAAVRRISQMASPFRSSKSGANGGAEDKKKGGKKGRSNSGSQRAGATSPTSGSQIPIPITSSSPRGSVTATNAQAPVSLAGASRSISSPSSPPPALGGKPVHVYEAEIAKLNAELAGRGAVIDDMRAQLNRTFDDVRSSQDKAHYAERQMAELSSEHANMKKENEELLDKIRQLEDSKSDLTHKLSEIKADLDRQADSGKEHEQTLLGIQEEKQALIEKNNRLKETIELMKEEVQEAKAGERQRAEANNGEITILMEKITQLQNTNSSLLADNEKLRLDAERLREESEESEESDGKEELAKLTKEFDELKKEHVELTQQLASEKIEKERAMEETDILSNNIKRMRAALEGVTEENDGLHEEIEKLRNALDRAMEAANNSHELEFYKGQFARLAAENDELKRSLDKTTAQLQVARDSAVAAAAESYRGRATTYEERGQHTRSNSRSSRNWSMDIPNTPSAASLRSDPMNAMSTSPVRDRFMFTATPDVDTMSNYSGGSGNEARSTTTTEERSNGDSSGRYDYRPEASPDTSATSVNSARNSPLLNQRRFSSSFRSDERNIDDWNEDLHRLLAEKERLQNDYSRIPLTGGGPAMRRRKENLEAKMDEVDKELSSVKAQIKSLNPF